MRIAFILPELKGGGIGTYYRNLVQGIIESGEQVITILGNRNAKALDPTFPGKVVQISEDDYQRGLNVNRHFDHYPSIRHRIALSFACRESLERHSGADVIEITDYNLLFYYFLLEKTKHVIIRLAGSSAQLEIYEQRTDVGLESVVLFMLEKTLINEADYIISLSRSNQLYWQSLLTRKVNHHLPFLSYPFSKSADSSSSSGKGLVVGRLQLWKGAEFLCDYYNENRNSPSVQWMGKDNYYRDYRQSMANHLAKKYPEVWNSKVEFIGKRDYSFAQKAIADAAFIIVPSSWDTFNFVVTEAIWHGKIVIASDGAGASELIDHGTTGFVFQNENIASLRLAFEEYEAQLPQERLKMSDNAAFRIRELLNSETLLLERIEIFKLVHRSALIKNELVIKFIRQKLNHSISLDDKSNGHISIRGFIKGVAKKVSQKLFNAK